MQASKKALSILEDNLIIKDNTVRIDKQIDRKTYSEINSIFECLDGKWNSSQGVHIFPDDIDVETELDLIIATGEYVDIKKDFQLYATPKVLAETVAYFAHIKPTDFVIEPSVGLGAIADEVWNDTPNRPKELWGIELNTKLKRYLDKKPYKTFVGYDWLTVAAQPELQNAVDKIVMNPPFSKNADVDHVIAAYNCLKPGGCLVAIMSRHWQFGQEEKCKIFRELMTKDGELIQQLEPGEFKESGTQVATCIISIYKGANTYSLDWVNDYENIINMDKGAKIKNSGPPEGLTDASFEKVIKDYVLFKLSQEPLTCEKEKIELKEDKASEEVIEDKEVIEIKQEVEVKQTVESKKADNKQTKKVNKVKGYNHIDW